MYRNTSEACHFTYSVNYTGEEVVAASNFLGCLSTTNTLIAYGYEFPDIASVSVDPVSTSESFVINEYEDQGGFA